MVYLYKKKVGEKVYYYLRASKQAGKKVVTKDIAYLGNTIDEVRKSLVEQKGKEIRNAYKKMQKFLASNQYLELAQQQKLKTSPYFSKDLLEQVEACKLHWQQEFQKKNHLTKQEYYKHFIIDFTFNTTSIEGNTITLKETEKLLTEHLTPKDKTLREVFDMQNTEKVFFEMMQNAREIDEELISAIHQELMKNIDPRIGYRTGEVRVIRARFKATPAPYIRADMGILLKLYQKQKKQLHPLLLAAIMHHKFEKIHPFFDGNGRTGRILLNKILWQEDYPPLIVRKKNRTTYLEALEKADTTALSEMDAKKYKPLVEFIATEYVDTYWNNFL